MSNIVNDCEATEELYTVAVCFRNRDMDTVTYRRVQLVEAGSPDLFTLRYTPDSKSEIEGEFTERGYDTCGLLSIPIRSTFTISIALQADMDRAESEDR